MDTVRIADLLAPVLEKPLLSLQLDQISIYIDLLKRWNARINLTAIREDEEIVTRHFGESLFMARHLFPEQVARTLLSANADSAQSPEDSQPNCHPERSRVASEARDPAKSKDPYPSPDPEQLHKHPDQPRVIDIGSGAGFPALPLKIWAPEIHLTLIESNHKKCAFLREAIRALTLTDVNVMTARAETVASSPNHPEAEVVTLRAVEDFNTVLTTATAFLTDQAKLALLITTAQLPKVMDGTMLRWRPPLPIPLSKTRILSIADG
jgi:16S rRNA (guanine527-N7)-methyltransferase